MYCIVYTFYLIKHYFLFFNNIIVLGSSRSLMFIIKNYNYALVRGNYGIVIQKEMIKERKMKKKIDTFNNQKDLPGLQRNVSTKKAAVRSNELVNGGSNKDENKNLRKYSADKAGTKQEMAISVSLLKKYWRTVVGTGFSPISIQL